MHFVAKDSLELLILLSLPQAVAVAQVCRTTVHEAHDPVLEGWPSESGTLPTELPAALMATLKHQTALNFALDDSRRPRPFSTTSTAPIGALQHRTGWVPNRDQSGLIFISF